MLDAVAAAVKFVQRDDIFWEIVPDRGICAELALDRFVCGQQIRHLHIELLGALFADKIDLLFACFAYCYGLAAAQQLQKPDIFEDQVDVP